MAFPIWEPGLYLSLLFPSILSWPPWQGWLVLDVSPRTRHATNRLHRSNDLSCIYAVSGLVVRLTICICSNAYVSTYQEEYTLVVFQMFNSDIPHPLAPYFRYDESTYKLINSSLYLHEHACYEAKKIKRNTSMHWNTNILLWAGNDDINHKVFISVFYTFDKGH